MAARRRRQHPRLTIRLPVAHRPAASLAVHLRHDFTTDISAGGTQLVVTGRPPPVGEKMELELTIPPGEGHFPYSGKIRGVGTVLRSEPVRPGPGAPWAVATRFDQPLNLDFT